MLKTVEKIKDLVKNQLADDRLFLVDALLTGTSQPKLTIIIDGDEGVTIEDCAKLSREVGHEIEQGGLIETPYTLNVSSPGLDHPLKLKRQYQKNIGRDIRVIKNDEGTLEGSLIAVSGDTIRLLEKQQKETTTVLFNDIKKTFVLASFKK